MAEKEYTDEEIEELDSFLQFEFYYGIYKELANKNGKYFDLFEPLECCRVMSLSVELVAENKAKPLTISRHLKKEFTLLYGEKPLTDEQRFFLYEYILDFFGLEKLGNEQLTACCSEILKLQQSLDVKWETVETPKSEDKFDFQKTLEHSETLSDYKEKIAYLIQQKTKFEQNQKGSDWNLDNEKNFAEKCQLEIDKLEKLRQLEATPKQTTDGIKKHKALTLDRATLLLNYLFTYTKANCHNTKKAEVISFLTGYSENTIGDKLSALHSKADDNFINYEKDMMIVRKYFENLGLSEIVEMIDRDLNI